MMDKVKQLLARAQGRAEARLELGHIHDDREVITEFLDKIGRNRETIRQIAKDAHERGFHPDKSLDEVFEGFAKGSTLMMPAEQLFRVAEAVERMQFTPESGL